MIHKAQRLAKDVRNFATENRVLATRKVKSYLRWPSESIEAMRYCCTRIAGGHLSTEEDLRLHDKVLCRQWMDDNPWLYAVLGGVVVMGLGSYMVGRLGREIP